MKGLNQLPSLNGISHELSPNTLLTGDPSPYFSKLSTLNFGDYAQVHRHNKLMNTLKARNVGGIALYPSGNDQRGWIFMALATGKTIHSYIWTTLPVGEDVINRVHKIALEK